MFAPRQAHGWSTATLDPVLAATSCTVEEVTDYATFLGLEREWNDTVLRAGIPHPFLRHEWVRAWWDAFGASFRLHILVVRTEGRIIAIAPLMRDSAQMYGLE